YKLDPVAERLSYLLNKPVKKLEEVAGPSVRKAVAEMNPGDVVMLENIRFHPGETSNDPDLAKELASYGDIYINDAFGATHRAHASIAGVCDFIKEKGMGYLIKKELDNLSKVTEKPALPFITILGGAKVSGKIDLINFIADKVDLMLIGGGMMFTFLKAQGYNIGKSLLEEDKLDLAKELLETNGNKIILPADTRIVEDIGKPETLKTVKITEIPENAVGIDIGPETENNFSARILKAKTVLFNGPMGIFEEQPYSSGTQKILESIASAKCISIVGGGDSAAAASKFGFDEVFTHISTGGGASLEFLSGKEMPGIESLRK
ncbi:MAG TPA: phosphoglycerate kinase, partial [Firmicutes bacterium]|nr:phosphoglycerate kinase [Bacillota bacterium]